MLKIVWPSFLEREMTPKELVERLRDSSISDEVIYKDLNDYLDLISKDDVMFEKLGEVSSLGEVLSQTRPVLFEKMRQEVIKDHEGCCNEDH